MISERPASVSPHRALVVRRRISGASKRDCHPKGTRAIQETPVATRSSRAASSRRETSRLTPAILDTVLQSLRVVVEQALEIDLCQSLTEYALQRIFTAGEGHLPGADEDVVCSLNTLALLIGLASGEQEEERNRAPQGESRYRRAGADRVVLDDENAADSTSVTADGSGGLDEVLRRLDGEAMTIVEQKGQELGQRALRLSLLGDYQGVEFLRR